MKNMVEEAVQRLNGRGRVVGRVVADLIDVKTGRIIKSRSRNIITRNGLARWDTALFTMPPVILDRCSVGEGLTVPADTDTAIETELETKDIGSLITTNVTGSNPYIVARTQYDEDEAIGDVTEIGLLFSDDVLFNRAFFGYGVITGATQANPVVITCADHGLVDSQRVLIQSVGGMTQLNNNTYYVNELSSSTFSLYSDAALSATIDGTGFGAYTSGGTFKVSIPKTSSTILVVRLELELSNA